MTAHDQVKEAVHQVLAGSTKPLKRETLRSLVEGRPGLFFGWSIPTWDRRIREAINELCREGIPVVSDGHGFRIATSDRRIREAINELCRDGIPVVSDGHGFRIATSREELEAGLQRKERMAKTLLIEVAYARRIPLGRLVTQLGLFDEAQEGVA